MAAGSLGWPARRHRQGDASRKLPAWSPPFMPQLRTAAALLLPLLACTGAAGGGTLSTARPVPAKLATSGLPAPAPPGHPSPPPPAPPSPSSPASAAPAPSCPA